MDYYSLDEKLVRYLLKNYGHLMTLHEAGALKNFILDEKLQIYDVKSEEYRNAVDRMKFKDVAVAALMENGIDHFAQSFAKRVMEEYPDKIILNKCPKCGELARTPLAKQCPHCFHSWH